MNSALESNKNFFQNTITQRNNKSNNNDNDNTYINNNNVNNNNNNNINTNSTNNNTSNTNSNYKYIRNYKECIFGIFLILLGFFFFILMFFWLISSKLFPPSIESYQNYPTIIKFLVKDKVFGPFIILIVPVTIVVCYFRKMSQYSFRHYRNPG